VNNICLKSIDKDNPSSLATYETMGGYKVWRKILHGELSPEKILEELKISGLRGRGGACVGGPMCQIGDQYYENLTKKRIDEILDGLK